MTPTEKSNQESCRACGSTWKEDPIPEERNNFMHYNRRIGIEISNIYDGVIIWKCPDCNHMVHRFSCETVTENDIETNRVLRSGLSR